MEKIFYYTDFRRWLADYYSNMKESNPVFSYRWFAQKAGMSSAGLFTRVVKGERNLTAATTEQFITGMELSDREADYFRALVGFGQARTSSEKQNFYSTMVSMSEFVDAHQMEIDEYSYFTKWYLPALRELIVISKFTGDNYSLLADSIIPSITEREVKSGIELLIRLGYLEIQENGEYIQRDRAITSGKSDEKIAAMARRSFNRKMITLAAESLDRFKVGQRYATGMTLGISDSCYDAIVQEIVGFRERIALLVDRDKGEQKVCQLNFQLFPLTETRELNDEEQI